MKFVIATLLVAATAVNALEFPKIPTANHTLEMCHKQTALAKFSGDLTKRDITVQARAACYQAVNLVACAASEACNLIQGEGAVVGRVACNSAAATTADLSKEYCQAINDKVMEFLKKFMPSHATNLYWTVADKVMGGYKYLSDAYDRLRPNAPKTLPMTNHRLVKRSDAASTVVKWATSNPKTTTFVDWAKKIAAAPKSRPCNDASRGHMYCGTTSGFVTCDHHQWIFRHCGLGTKCNQNGNYITCGW